MAKHNPLFDDVHTVADAALVYQALASRNINHLDDGSNLVTV